MLNINVIIKIRKLMHNIILFLALFVSKILLERSGL